MENLEIYNIRQLSIKAIRDFILDNNLSNTDTILLNQADFDEYAYEYKETYNENLRTPFFFLHIKIQEDITGTIKPRSLGVLRNDLNRFGGDSDQSKNGIPNKSYAYDTIYRCGWCGNVVDFDGSEFDAETRLFKIKTLETYRDTVIVKKVNGRCCPNG